MRMMQNAAKIRRRGGDTIIEVVVSAIIFLLAMAVLQGAVTFSQKALNKNYEMRDNYSAMMKAMPDAATTSGTDVEYEFYAYLPDETTKGEKVFTVTVNRAVKTVTFTDTDNLKATRTFSVFAAKTGS